MSGWDYDNAGKFPDKHEAEQWARSNGIEPRYLHIREGRDGAEVSVRRSALNKEAREDRRFSRKDGF